MSHRDIITPLLLEAGRIIRTATLVETAGGVTEKGADSANLVTYYDTAVQAYLIEHLRAAYPDAAFMAEEQENDPAVLAAERCFIIDPIDGTANFIHGYRRSAISLAMLERGEIVLAAVHDPYLDETFTAERGKGAYLNGTPIQVSERKPRNALCVFGTAPYGKEKFGAATFRLAEALFRGTRDVRRSGSAALDLAHVAAGRCDLFFELALSPWDIAAGILLIREAGGIITDLNGAPLSLSAPTPVLAANPACYEFLKAEAAAAMAD
ncbi:MAG: inositol monophosphatase [Clostridia bacterium]|nr:inositol monophosphatase [Clostridia bacterium]